VLQLNIENMKKWAAALRSGEYKQARNFLERENGSLCCLGVAHHCLLGTTPNAEIAKSYLYNAYNAISNALTVNAQDNFLTQQEYQVLQDLFVQANDSEGRTFLEIANMVDALINRALAQQEQVYAEKTPA
jgi:hypothetical protein